MRLRYLHIWSKPPLQNLATTFNQETILGRKCAIRFVVGVNGSGKTQLLQALCDLFLNLENSQLPPFKVVLAYDLEQIGEEDRPTTVYLRSLPDTTPAQAIFAVFANPLPDTTDWENLETIPTENLATEVGEISVLYRGNQLPGGTTLRSYLPKVLLAYTSGATSAWTALFQDRRPDRENLPDAVFEEIDLEEERPAGWDLIQEAPYRERTELEPLTELEQTQDGAQIRSLSYYVSPEVLKLALFAVALHQARVDFLQMPTEQAEQAYRDRINQSVQDDQPMRGRRGLFNKIDWLWLVTVDLHIILQPNRFNQSRELERLYASATSVIRDPGPREIPLPTSGRHVIFDLRRSLPEQSDVDTSTCTALIRAICNQLEGNMAQITPFDIFKQLFSWYEAGWLKGLTMTLRKRNADDLLLYDWLSDGEREFLGRMALFQILQGQNDALMILDEPETHFNDVWKREIVDVIDTSLRDNSTEVLISTHSSISLTDVFDTEVTLLYKNINDGSIAIIETPIPTFGASPNEVMTDIFGAAESVGQRATEFLDLVLMLAAHPAQVETIWAMNGDRSAVLSSPEFQQLKAFIRELPHQYGDENEEQFDNHLLNILASIRGSTQAELDEEVTVSKALQFLQEKVGPGFYELEFRRRLRLLRQQNSNASSD
uniref:AAA family ATPase n=1 Tax=Trichocoleus desertorum TaxID=1481672 RepID=UPI0025B537DE|nr:AAA family ATPase [Trichocoleus desertorum]